jgi:secretion/DNA translocation related TadE-like protein
VIRARRDAGAAVVWVVCCCALLVVVGGVSTARGLAVLARHRAEAAADLAALAGAARIGFADDACPAAAAVAARNRARLSYCRLRLAPDGRSGTVEVRVLVPVRLPWTGAATAEASARAGRLPTASADVSVPPTAVGRPESSRPSPPVWHAGRGP